MGFALHTRILSVVLALFLCATQQVALAQQSTSETQQPQAAPENQPAQNAPATQNAPEQTPSVTPVQPENNQNQPAQPVQTLPDSPSTSRPAQPAQQNPSRPVGTAAAEIGNASGTTASKPAGVAIAPAKQRQSRSFLIKMGAIAGVAVAVGAVVALTSGSPSKPPNSP